MENCLERTGGTGQWFSAEPLSRRGLIRPPSHRAGRNAGRWTRSQRGADGGAAEDGVAVVEDGGLPFGYAAGWVVQADSYSVVLHPGGAGVDLAVGAELDEAVAGLGRLGRNLFMRVSFFGGCESVVANLYRPRRTRNPPVDGVKKRTASSAKSDACGRAARRARLGRKAVSYPREAREVAVVRDDRGPVFDGERGQMSVRG